MKIKIKGNAHELYVASIAAGNVPSLNDDWYGKLKAIAGKTLVVETKYLFKDQFNTAPIEGVSELGLRVMVQSVEEVIDDEREWSMRCNYCGKTSRVSPKCTHCEGEDKYLEPLSEAARVTFDSLK